MDELTERVAAARRTWADPAQAYDDAWLERRGRAFRTARVRRARARRFAQVAALASVALAGGSAVHHYASPRDHAAAIAPPHAPATTPLTIEEGSTVTPFDPTTVFVLKEASPDRSLVELVSGGARFQIAHRPARAFRVEAGPALVEVLGTEFTVERMAERVRVSVLSGQVQVTASGRTSQLVEGETAMFPRPIDGSMTPNDTASAATDETQLTRDDPPLTEMPLADRDASSSARSKGATRGKWRTLASRGHLGDAYRELERDGWAIPVDASSLLLAADVARRTGHPAQAVAPLRRMLRLYPRDPRAAAAAFTLGRVLMDTGTYRDAAASFAQAWSLDTSGVIAEDAAAREVEAWSRAGEGARARERANAFSARYPKGRRLDAVRRYGGLEE